MQYGIRNIFSRTIIIMMLFFVCLPCTAKREIKLVLDIPINELKNNTNNDQSVVCFTAIDKTAKKTLGSLHDHDLKNYPSRFTVFQHPRFTLKIPITSIWEKKSFKIIPVYLLHEQYLI
ncbi:hypothetical protein [Flavobacterium aquidurense]|uniref:Uncharacterized protein n=1 Tax=Flavobacterium aquidurense TaxID=362413 RepID=A0A0Q0X2Q0_9FLAO|nr:hypothetical protein [Flavobacterium aquidurense]KQB42699.1 hypothetical protein RC62_3706 [Flavobacterium aquidurense]